MTHIALRLLFATTLFIVDNHLFGQAGDLPFNPEPGKCYAKCLIPNSYEDVEADFPIYLGSTDKKVELDSVYFTIEKRSGKLLYLGYRYELDERKYPDTESLPKIVFLTSLKGLKPDEFYQSTIHYLKLTKPGGIAEWRLVLCNEKVNRAIISQIQEALFDLGYLDYIVRSSELEVGVKKALSRYQRENNLPMGNLDFETLNALGVRY